jgi:hypothetical protein
VDTLPRVQKFKVEVLKSAKLEWHYRGWTFELLNGFVHVDELRTLPLPRVSTPRIDEAAVAITVSPAIMSQEFWNALIKTAGFSPHCVYGGTPD